MTPTSTPLSPLYEEENNKNDGDFAEIIASFTIQEPIITNSIESITSLEKELESLCWLDGVLSFEDFLLTEATTTEPMDSDTKRS